MKKILQILLGFFLILVLAYFSFSEVSGKIKNDLLSKAKTKFIDKGIIGINVQVEGEGLSLSRTLILTGTTGSEQEKSRIASLIGNLDGVGHINNEIHVEARKYTVPSVTAIPIVKKVDAIVPMAKKAIKMVLVVEPVKEKMLEPKKSMVLLPTVQKVVEPISAVTSVDKELEPTEIVVQIPAVPVVTKNIPKVPTAIKVVAVPTAIEAEQAIINEENKNIKMQGVE